MIKKIGICLMVFVCILFVSLSFSEENNKDVNIKVKTGIHGVGVDGKTKVKVGEYDVLDTGVNPDVSFSLDGRIENTYFSGEATYYEDDDQQYSGNIDMQRYVTEEFSYYRFYHWLDHDPLTNLRAAATNAKEGGKVIPPLVTYTDLEPSTEYGIMRSEMESKTTVRVPMDLPFELKAFFNYRKEMRKGRRQALTMGGKCSACHVVSNGKVINEHIEDYNPGFVATFRNKSVHASFSYEFLDRKFGEDALAPEIYYDDPVHPGGKGYIFDDRIQYQDAKLPYNQLPKSRKFSHKAKLNTYIPSMSTGMFLGGIYSRTENEEQDLQFNLKSIFSRLSSSIIPGLAMNVHFRWLDLANESIFVDTNEPTGIAGPNAGHTYADPSHGGTYNANDPDFVRDSAMSRKQYEVGFDAAYLLMKGITLRGSYLWKQIERDHYYLSGENETEEHRLKLGINARFTPPIIKKPIRTSLSYKYQSIYAPFANENAAFVGEESTIAGGPFNGTQYWELQEMRNKTLTNLPTRRDEIRFDTTIPILDRLSITGFYRFMKEENDSVGWKNWTHMPSISLWYAPFDKLNFSMSYLYRHGKTTNPLCVPIYDG